MKASIHAGYNDIAGHDYVLPGPVKRRADEAIFVGGHR